MRRQKKCKRWNWLSDMITEHSFTIGAEVGVYKGMTMRYLLQTHLSLFMYAVDLWKYDPDIMQEREKRIRKDEDQEHMRELFIRAVMPVRKRVKILRGVSWEIATKVSDESLDFVFIDADHGYEAVKKDIKAWHPKVKKGGLVSGHDINLPGVEQAVSELSEHVEKADCDNIWFYWKK